MFSLSIMASCGHTGEPIKIPVGKEMLVVVDTLGNPQDGQGPIGAKEMRPIILKTLPLPRQTFLKITGTGIKVVDFFTPIVKGVKSGCLEAPV